MRFLPAICLLLFSLADVFFFCQSPTALEEMNRHMTVFMSAVDHGDVRLMMSLIRQTPGDEDLVGKLKARYRGHRFLVTQPQFLDPKSLTAMVKIYVNRAGPADWFRVHLSKTSTSPTSWRIETIRAVPRRSFGDWPGFAFI